MGTGSTYQGVSRRPPDLEDYMDMLRRYRGWIAGPMFGGLVLAVAAAFVTPDMFVSYAVLTVKPQQVSEKLIPSVVSASQMNERIQQMETDIESRTSLSEIIQKPGLDLYPRQRARMPLEDVIQSMKNKDLKIAPYNNVTGDRRLASAIIVQFRYPDRHKAAAVVQEIVNRLLEQSTTSVDKENSLTVSILKDEVANAGQKKDAAEAALTRFEVENAGRLPSQSGANSQAFTQIQIQLMNLGQQMARDRQDKLLLETQLENLRNDQNAAAANLFQTVSGGETVSGGQTVSGGPITVRNEKLINLNKEITNLKSTLAALMRVYGPNYPEIANTEAQIAVLEQEQAALEKQEAAQPAANPAPPPQKIINPAAQKAVQGYQAQQNTVRAQIAAKQAEVEDLTRQKAQLEKQMAVYQRRMEEAPLNEQKYASLVNDLNLAKADYEEKIKRQRASDTAQNVEEHKAGEQLELLDSPNVPDRAVEPDRLIWAGAGTFMGMLCGLMLSAAQEVKNRSLNSLKDVRAYTNLPVLSSIPLLENISRVRTRRLLVRLAWSAAAMAGVVLMSSSVYYYYYMNHA